MKKTNTQKRLGLIIVHLSNWIGLTYLYSEKWPIRKYWKGRPTKLDERSVKARTFWMPSGLQDGSRYRDH